jgi:hypothetical protein
VFLFPAPVVCCDSTAYQDKHFFCPLSLCMNGIFFFTNYVDRQNFTPLLQVCSEKQTSILNYNGPKFIMVISCVVKL